jgi:lysyl-tRNA synthetase class 2
VSEADAPAGPSGSTEAERRAKVDRLRAEGIDPFPRDFPGRTKIEAIHGAHDPAQLEEGPQEGVAYRIAGRLTGKRGHGKTVFFDVRDLTGTIQAYARVDSIGEQAFGRIEDLDIGDIVGVDGDQARSAGARRARGDAARQGASRPA